MGMVNPIFPPLEERKDEGVVGRGMGRNNLEHVSKLPFVSLGHYIHHYCLQAGFCKIFSRETIYFSVSVSLSLTTKIAFPHSLPSSHYHSLNLCLFSLYLGPTGLHPTYIANYIL